MRPAALRELLREWADELTRLETERQRCGQQRREAERDLAAQRAQALAELDASQEAEQGHHAATRVKAQTTAHACHEQRRQWIEERVRRRRDALNEQRREALRQLRSALPPPDDGALSDLTRRRVAFDQAIDAARAQLDAVKPTLALLRRRLQVADKPQGRRLLGRGKAEALVDPLAQEVAAVAEGLTEITVAVRRAGLAPLIQALVLSAIGLLHGLVALALWAWSGLPPLLTLGGVALSLIVCLGLRLDALARFRRRYGAALRDLADRHISLWQHLAELTRVGHQQLDVGRCVSHHSQQAQQVDEERLAGERRIDARHEAAMQLVQARARSLLARLERRIETARTVADLGQQAVNDELAQRQAAERSQCEAAWEETTTARLSALDAACAAADQAWAAGLAAGRQRLAALAQALPPAPAQGLALGRLSGGLQACLTHAHVPEERLDCPLQGDLPAFAQLWLRSTSSAGRAHAQALMRGAALALLEQFPPGQVRMTIFDPVGLGQSVADFLPLIDFDERLLGPKVWTQAHDLEQRLALLVAHTEMVIQKHLQQRHPDISHYNAEAGELAEPYRLLILLDAPQGLRDLARERLTALIQSGARCGVFVWLHQHGPEVVAPSECSGWAFIERDEQLHIHAPDLGALVVEPPSVSAPTLDARIQALGAAARDAARVAIHMRVGMPADGARWSLDSAEELRIPIGRCGAEKMQYLTLGPGMAQHVLIGGRTGSGKSTLLHVLITGACLWYAPEQLQVALIDFKKGVEFRAYAAEGLPHARVVAIESDREFALSVLEDIDRELDRRGTLFRQHGVQNLAQYRQACGAALPRQLLVIDEFHEFFAEDDSLSRSVALLLDRLVRQGRAFGIHAVLGSQSLAGCYELGKSTLGQIAVRIALQCNEADSYLLLSEDNPAARYLERPGEGIYNDRSGLPEGNALFQVFWLTEAERVALLGNLRQQAGAAAPRPIVFEGSAPARLADQRQLLAAAPAAGWHCWLGQPNALDAACTVDLASGASRHLLLVGQQREAACGIALAVLIALVRQHGPELAIDCFDAADDQRFSALLEHLAGTHAPQLRRLTTDDCEHWEADFRALRPRLILILGLDKWPFLAEPPDDPFALDATATEGPGALLARCLRGEAGPACHVILWSSAAAALQRSLQRKTRQALTRRVLFQMSPADSNELLDDGTASRLGLYHALLAEIDRGRREKFRPYALPDPEQLADLLAP